MPTAVNATSPNNQLCLAVLISGSGRTLANLIERSAAGALAATIDLVIANRSEIRGLGIARAADIPAAIMPQGDQPVAAWSEAIFTKCRDADVDLVVMAGFLQLLAIPADFANRVINIHPSLLPAFGGKGFYGQRVHQAVLDRGCTVSGCTVHYVDNEYDHGQIILQEAVTVMATDTAESLATRVFAAESETLPKAINLLAERHRPPPPWRDHVDELTH